MEENEKYAIRMREELEKFGKVYGEENVWGTNQMCEEFEVLGFMTGLCVVKRRSDGQLGSLEFQHMPRVYHSFVRSDYKA